MLRRGSGGLYVNGVVLRFPVAGVSMRDIETFTRTNLNSKPDLASADLQLRNIYFTESGAAVFQGNTIPGLSLFALDLAANNLTAGSAISQSLFTALPTPLTLPTGIGSLDWTPPADRADRQRRHVAVWRTDLPKSRVLRHTDHLSRGRGTGRCKVVGWVDRLRP